MNKTEFLKEIKENFTKIPNNIIIDNEYKLSDLERMVIIKMIQKNNDNKNISFVSIENLSVFLYQKDAETQRKNVSRVLHTLKEKGLINIQTTHQYHKQHKNVIQVNSYSLNQNKFSDSYLKIPNQVLDSAQYEWKDRLFAIQLFSVIWSGSDRISLTNGQIAEKLNSSRPTINKKIRKFNDLGFIQVNKSDYQVNISSLMQMNEQPTPKIATKEAHTEPISIKTGVTPRKNKERLKTALNAQKQESDLPIVSGEPEEKTGEIKTPSSAINQKDNGMRKKKRTYDDTPLNDGWDDEISSYRNKLKETRNDTNTINVFTDDMLDTYNEALRLKIRKKGDNITTFEEMEEVNEQIEEEKNRLRIEAIERKEKAMREIPEGQMLI
ncbi:hypothetical protein [Marinilabilia salmonicolor]|uniref:Helix-turn-helix protein n=1 Tax=Marinilabilia salmonicolor TaxID=989 RepID=A0A368VI48_9BACT|nr:hypothetical protein [Marinilabilia salmonicolor]RCW38681.1 hypothetical protein DFO77_103151 [Marinilabilia salmonicolor]